jgi:prepilin-type N-terminal cleavage/methylation domain-containing protein
MQNTAGQQKRVFCQWYRGRAAMTLVEVMVAVTVMSIMLGVAISFLIGLKHWDRKVHQFGLRNEQLTRLAESIRTDIRHATDVSLPSGNALVILLPGNKETRYELTPEGCRRLGMPGDARPLTDLFSVGPATSWTVERDAPGNRSMFVVTLNHTQTDSETQLAPLLVYAALGADLPQRSNNAD